MISRKVATPIKFHEVHGDNNDATCYEHQMPRGPIFIILYVKISQVDIQLGF